MANPEVDRRYYQVAKPRSLAERLTIAARANIYRDFLRLCQPTPEDNVLDFGVSDVVGESPNLLERLYPHRARITALGLGSAEAFQAEFPDVEYRQVTANAPLPFADQSFAIATSNAVLEHVGSEEDQRRFVAEMMRVAAKVFISVPNRFFPVEHHTGLPLAHYCDISFVWACRMFGKAEWADRSQLILMSRRRLRAALPIGAPVEIGWTGLNLGPFSSNLYAYCQQRSGAVRLSGNTR